MVKAPKKILSDLRKEKIDIAVEGDQLQILSYEGKLSDTLIKDIKLNKEALIQYLKSLNTYESSLSIPVAESMYSYPLSNTQRRLWILSQSDEASATYNMFSYDSLKGNYDIDNFKNAINAVIERHEILRTVFREDDNKEVRQWILPIESLGFNIDYKDFRGSSDSNKEIKTYIDEDRYRPFDLKNGPLLRASLLQISDDYYVFYYNMHHIISDGWSMDVLVKDVMHFYNSLMSNEVPALSPLEIQYKDFSVWQFNQLSEDSYQKDKEYWLSQFSGKLPVLDLPSQKIRPQFKTHNGKSLSTYISSDVTQRLKSFCGSQGGSLYMGLLASWYTLFYRYTSTDDIIIGTALSGRDHADLQNQIGFYINTLAVRNQMSSEDTFTTLFGRVKESMLQGFKHQSYTLDKLVTDLSLTNVDSSRNPLFDTLLTFMNIGANQEVNLSNEEIDTIVNLGDCMSKFDIDITISEKGNYLSVNLKYNTDVYDELTIEQLLRSYKALLESIVNQPEEEINTINVLPSFDRDKILQEFNATDFQYDKTTTLVDLFLAQAEKTPDHTAVVYKDKSYTYKELDVLSNQLAHCLKEEYNVEQEDLIGIQLDRNESIVISILGILKCGGAYVPINPELPEARKEHIVNDTNLKLLITDTSYMFDLGFYDGEMLAIDVEFEPDSYDEKPLDITIDVSNLAYIIYTSGSTGMPKGVMVEHRNVVNLITYQSDYFGVNEDDNFLLFSNTSFDASVEQFYLALLNGATLYVVQKSDLLDIDGLQDILIDNKITHLHAVPSFLRALPCIPNSSLKRLVSGGDSFDLKIAQEWGENVTIINEYGPTETTVTSIQSTIDTDSLNTIVIGKPLGNTYCYILNKNNTPQPIGVVGDLYISGDGITRGYLNQPELTEEKFVPNLFREGEKMYKTGDLARWLPCGNIEFIGRDDDQVKVRGYRIELSEIERSLLSMNNVEQVVVLLKETEEGDEELTAYLVSKTQQNISGIREYLLKNLPPYMIPGYYVQLDEIPLTSNGKVDKSALKEISGVEISCGIEHVSASTKEEVALASVWSSVLNKKEISIKDSFYNLGGDSIKSIQVVSRLKQKGYNLRVEQILRTPVLEDLAKLMNENIRAVDQSTVSGNVLLNPIQHSFFDNPFIKTNHHYNQSILLRSIEKIDTEALDRSISKLVAHHDALRLIYKREENTWIQTNQDLSGNTYSIDFYDLSEADDEFEMMSQIGEELQSSFNLEEGPLFKVGHFRLSDGDRLALIAHHLVIDGVSWRILLEDLSTLYYAYKINTIPNIPLKTDSFQYWSSLQNKYLEEHEMISERLYWKSICEKPIQRIPVDFEKKGEAIRFDGVDSFTLNESLTELIQTKVNRAYGTEINDVLLTGLGLAIKDVFGIDKSVLKMEGHGREEIIDDVDISRTIGWFTSVYPFILDVSETGDIKDSLIQVKEDLRKIPNKGIGYGMLRYLTDGFVSNITPEIIFNYLGDFGDKIGDEEESFFEYSTEDIGPSMSSNNGQDTILDVSGMMASGKLNMSIRYSRLLHQPETIQQLKDSFLKHLETLINELSVIEENYLTPSDMTFKGLTVGELAELNSDGTLEDVYKLSPLQEGMYYNWMSDKSSSMYFEQISYRLRASNLDISQVKEAYDQLINRYSVLRTSFVNDYGGMPLQVVRKSVPSSFTYENAVDVLEIEDIERYVEEVRLEDKRQGFDLEGTSQMRLKVLNLGNDSYEFIWSNHHILMDGWCISILIGDFYQLMNAIANNKPAELPPINSYSNYISWLEKVNKDSSLDYWKNYLLDYNNLASVPFKVKDSDQKEYEICKETLRIKGDLYDKIDQLCNANQITQNTLVQGVWGYLLSQYNNTKDVVFGSVVSGRPGELSGVESMIGLFINTIPVRVSYEKEDSAHMLLKGIQNEAIKSNSHHYLNLSEVQSLSELGMDLMNHIMIFENYPVQDNIKENMAETQDEEEQVFEIESIQVFEQTNYDFYLSVSQSESALSVSFNYNGKKYIKDRIVELTQHFYKIIDQFSTNPDIHLSAVDYLSVEEKEDLLKIAGISENELGFRNTTIIDEFHDQVRENPNNTAVVYDDKEFTYAEVDRLSNKLANYLIENYQVKTNDLISLKLERNEWMIISMLGVLKAGGAYVPVDPEFPAERIAFIENDSNCTLSFDKNVLAQFVENQEVYSSESLSVKIEPNDLAYAIYTSGSTGKPKGVLIEHGNLSSLIENIEETFHFKGIKKIAATTNFTFDISVIELLGAVSKGMTVDLFSSNTLSDPKLTIKRLKDNQIDGLQVTPSRCFQLISVADDFYQDLSVLLIGGEAINKDLYNRLKASNPKVVQVYGPTETTIWSTSMDLKDSSDLHIGKPLKNESVYILNDEMQLVAKDVIGEICIGGVGVARGYLNRPELTKEKFVNNPFKSEERLYKTGDLGCWSSDGNIRFVGRKDDQVKIRGHRIELGEIAFQLKSEETINEVVVLARKTEENDSNLVAYVVSDVEQNIDDLRNYLLEKLPEYMIPKSFIQVDNIPLNSSGKINRKALLDYRKGEMSTGVDYVAPTSDEEKLIVTICEDVLKRKPISVQDNFYNLGGDSIKSIRVISRLKKAGYILKVSDLLSKPILKDIAKCICIIDNETSHSTLKQKSNSWDLTWKEGDQIELSPNQLRFHSSTYFQIIKSFTIENYDGNSFEKQLRSFLSLFPHLCVKYIDDFGKTYQEYVSSNEVKLSIIEKDELITDENEIEKLITSHFIKPYDIYEGELIRVFIAPYESGAEVFVSLYHSLADDYTGKVLQKELVNFFAKSKISNSYIPHFGFIKEQKKFLASKEGLTQRNYWMELLNHLPDIKNSHTEDVDITDCITQKIIISGSDFDTINNILSVTNIPITALFLGAYQSLLKELDLENKYLYGVLVNSREQNIEGIDINQVVGVLDNMLVLPYSKLQGDFDVTYVNNAYGQYLEARMNQEIPYEIIREDFNEKFDKDIQKYQAGRFNFFVNDFLLKINESNEVIISSDTFPKGNEFYTKIASYANAIEIEFVCPKEMYDTKKEEVSLQSFVQKILRFK